MLTLEAITLREIGLELVEPFRISSGETSRRRILLLELRDTDGVVVWSECVAGERPNYSPETIDTAWLVIRDHLAPRILGFELASAAEAHVRLGTDIRGHRMARAAVEMGLWCLEAERRQIPLARLLGAERERVAAGISIGIQASPAELAEKVTAAFERGYRKVKMKIEPGRDRAFVEAVRGRCGTDAPLMVDANNAYTLDDLPLLRALDTFALMMIEQPLAWDDIVQHAALQAELATPICLDESITGPDRVRDMIALRSGRIVNIKPGRVGGFASSLAIHTLCREAGIPVWCGGMLESGVGRGYNVALASLPGFTLPGDISPSERYWARDIVDPPWTMDVEGWLDVPLEASGLGVAVDSDRIEALTVRRETLRS